MVTPQEIRKVFTTRQLSYYKVSRNVMAGDLAVIRLKDEPNSYNNYSTAIHTELVWINNIVVNKKYDHLTKYTMTVFKDGSVTECALEEWQILSIYPIVVTYEAYQKAKKAYDKKIALEEKRKAEYEEQCRRDVEQQHAFEESIRKHEEEECQARIQAEKERRDEPMMITVGMWEDLMKRLSELENAVSDMENITRGLCYNCYGPGEEE